MLPAHGTLLVALQPFHYTVEVETMSTLSPHQGAVITSKLTVSTTTMERKSIGIKNMSVLVTSEQQVGIKLMKLNCNPELLFF